MVAIEYLTPTKEDLHESGNKLLTWAPTTGQHNGHVHTSNNKIDKICRYKKNT